MTLEQEISQILADVLALDAAPDIAAARDDIEVWDSLKHVELIFVLEEQFNITLPEQEFGNLTSVKAIARVVERSRAS